MTVEDTNTIDAIGVDKETRNVILKIFDHLGWENEHKHLLLLQDKLNTYMRFLESGEVYEAYKHARGKKFVISIAFASSPTANAIKFLDTAANITIDAGFELQYTIDAVKTR